MPSRLLKFKMVYTEVYVNPKLVWKQVEIAVCRNDVTPAHRNYYRVLDANIDRLG
jgi:hypothetical protein